MSDALITRCIIAAGGHKAGILLYRVCYWQPLAANKRDGKPWIAKTVQEWRTETQLTEKEHKLALRALIQKGLVVTCQKRFGTKVIGHVMLTPEGKKSTRSTTPKDPEPQAPKDPPGSALKGPPYLQGDTIKEKEEGFIFDESTSAYASKSGFGQKEEPMSPSPPGDFTPPPKAPRPSVAEVLAGAHKKAKPKDPDTWQSLQDVWVKLMPEVHGSYVVLSMKHCAQLKRIWTKSPPGTAAQVLEKVIRDWAGFCAVAESEAGAYKLPAKPTLGTIVAYLGTAVTFAVKQAPAMTGPSETSNQNSQIVAKKPKGTSDAATFDEVKALLGSK